MISRLIYLSFARRHHHKKPLPPIISWRSFFELVFACWLVWFLFFRHHQW